MPRSVNERAQFAYTATTDQFSMIKGHFLVVAAKTTIGYIFFEDDLFVFDKDFKTVFGTDVKGFAQFFRENNSAQLVNGANDTG